MKHIRTAAVTTAAVAMTVASLTATSATAASAPAFLSASELPASSTPWTADPVRPGLPEYSMCTEGAAPQGRTRHREFRTELDTTARQTTTVAPTKAKARALAAKLRRSVETCLDRLKAQYPDIEGETLHHGVIDVEEGAHVYSIDTAHPEVGSTDIALFSVGRDGRTVTVVEWGQLGDLDGAPLAGFQQTARTAVAKLH